MRQALWIVLIVAALAAGFFGGRFSSGSPAVGVRELEQSVAEIKQELESLSQRMDELASQPPSGALKAAYANAERAFLEFNQAAPSVPLWLEVQNKAQKEAEKLQAQLAELQERFQAGEISQREATQRALELQEKASAIEQLLMAVETNELVRVIKEVAKGKGYDLVVKEKNVILFEDIDWFEDITEEVTQRMLDQKNEIINKVMQALDEYLE